MSTRRTVFRLTIFTILFALLVSGLSAQEIRTASQFFDALAERYSGIVDYSAQIRMEREEAAYEGRISYRGPNQIRIDFEDPEEQVLVSDGRIMQVYIPQFNVVLEQELAEEDDDGDGGTGLATQEGLSLMRDGYSIAYLDSPEPTPLEEGSEEMVTKLRLNWKSAGEGFRQLTLSVTEELLIRRIEAVTVSYEEIVFDFTDIVLNEGIPTTRFDYEVPASANVFSGFLFGEN